MPRLRLLRRLRDESGAVSVEAVLWMPIFVFFVALVYDSSMLLQNRAHVLRAIQDANRAFAVGRLNDTAAVEAAIVADVRRFGSNVSASSRRNGNTVISEVSVRAGDLSAVGLLSMFADIRMTMTAHHMIEG